MLAVCELHGKVRNQPILLNTLAGVVVKETAPESGLGLVTRLLDHQLTENSGPHCLTVLLMRTSWSTLEVLFNWLTDN